MTTILRHGGEAHVVRPDRVYRTGVLTSIVGYQPQADVQAVAAAFTLGPPSGMQLSGLGASGGRLSQWWASLKARIAAKKAEKFMASAAPVSGPPIAQAPGPTASAAAGVLSPEMAGRAKAVFMLVGNPGMRRDYTIREAADVMAARRAASLYWAG